MKNFIYLFVGGILILMLLSCSQEKAPLDHEDGIISIENEYLNVKIDANGAELQSIQAKKSGVEYLWQGDPEYWSARSPVMFPVNVRFKDNQFTYKGTMYEMPRMGLAVNRGFKPLPKTENNQAKLELTSNLFVILTF